MTETCGVVDLRSRCRSSATAQLCFSTSFIQQNLSSSGGTTSLDRRSTTPHVVIIILQNVQEIMFTHVTILENQNGVMTDITLMVVVVKVKLN